MTDAPGPMSDAHLNFTSDADTLPADATAAQAQTLVDAGYTLRLDETATLIGHKLFKGESAYVIENGYGEDGFGQFSDAYGVLLRFRHERAIRIAPPTGSFRDGASPVRHASPADIARGVNEAAKIVAAREAAPTDELANLRRIVDKGIDSMADMNVTIADLRRQLAAVTAERDAARTELANAQTGIEKAAATLAAVRAEHAATLEHVDASQRSLARHIVGLKAQAARLTGNSAGIRFLHERDIAPEALAAYVVQGWAVEHYDIADGKLNVVMRFDPRASRRATVPVAKAKKADKTPDMEGDGKAKATGKTSGTKQRTKKAAGTMHVDQSDKTPHVGLDGIKGAA